MTPLDPQLENSPEQANEPREESRARARGIPFPILMDQVKNTAPFLFADDLLVTEKEPHLRLLRELEKRRATQTVDLQLAEYFHFALACHHATVATFVPTDVDVHIRFKLWQPPIPPEVRYRMAEKTIESLGWDFTRVSTRIVVSPETGQVLSGHQGEWFSTAVAAYAANRHAKELATEVLRMILAEIKREAAAFSEFKRAANGIGLHRCATVIAHNLGDLDRVVDQWELPVDDPLRTAVYKAGHEEGSEVAAELKEAGALNKAFMAVENHRNFALRVPRSLRRCEQLLVPIAPFLDDWGRKLAMSPILSAADKGSIAEALVDGWTRLPETVGYARALAGMESAMPGGAAALWNEMPARNARALQTGKLRQTVNVPEVRFHGAWERSALKFLKL